MLGKSKQQNTKSTCQKPGQQERQEFTVTAVAVPAVLSSMTV